MDAMQACSSRRLAPISEAGSLPWLPTISLPWLPKIIKLVCVWNPDLCRAHPAAARPEQPELARGSNSDTKLTNGSLGRATSTEPCLATSQGAHGHRVAKTRHSGLLP